MGNTTGGSNTAIGNGALFANTNGDSNTALGISAGLNITTASNVICIGTEGANVNNSCFIGNIYSNVQPIVGMDPDSVTITRTGRLGRGNVSSPRINMTSNRLRKPAKYSTRLIRLASLLTRNMIRPKHLLSA